MYEYRIVYESNRILSDVYEYRTFLEYSNWQGYNLKLEENINYLIDLYISLRHKVELVKI